MKPHNLSERNAAFRNFLMLFIITIGVVITAVFFSVQVPFKQNDYLREQMDLAKKQKGFSNNFSEKVSETIDLLDSVNRPDANAVLVDGSIEGNLKLLQDSVKKSTVISDQTDKDFYNNIINIISNLKSAKRDLRNASMRDVTMEELQNRITDLNAQLLQKTNLIQIYEAQIRQRQQ